MNKISKAELGIKLTGKVIRGDGYGKKLGFPTANIDRRQFVRDKLKIKLGVWSGRAQIQNTYKAAIVIGPIDKTGLPKIEAHLIGFKGNLYGKKISIYLSIYLRPYKNFKNQEELTKQIGRDVKRIKNYG